jgi:hypothetical protein
MSMKKTLLVMLTAALLATMLAGCSESTSTNAENKQKMSTPPLNTSQQAAAKKDDNKTPDISDSAQAVPDSTDASHLEVRDAFNLSGYRIVTPVALGAIAMGKVEMPIDEKQRLALAKAITSAMAESGWQPNDQPPGIFLRQDGGSFAIGMKRQNGDLSLNLYNVQADGVTWTLAKKETKPGKK